MDDVRPCLDELVDVRTRVDEVGAAEAVVAQVHLHASSRRRGQEAHGLATNSVGLERVGFEMNGLFGAFNGFPHRRKCFRSIRV